MKKDWFILELIRSLPFKILVFLVLFIFSGVYISKCKERQKKVQMKEDVLYIHPKPKVQK
ncbi:MAG TPA: hypothetical protein PLX87_04050 [Bacteroidales bacterium]|nr:hypothetical protein [Bacteroidales bacterium]HOU30909.1 hypothetical protein [Bacteroidales bacterium]HPP92847.1 hypothetical protein [Bacteroidales bacterium]HQK70600.1 hypothetical protein [Bacteroidales bacterium]